MPKVSAKKIKALRRQIKETGVSGFFMEEREKRRKIIFRRSLENYVKRQKITGELREALLRLGDNRVRSRRAAATRLARFKDKKVISPLISALKDPDSGVRGNATVSLRRLKAKQAFKPLLKAYENEISVEEAKKMLNALASLNPAKAKPTLIKTLRKEEPHWHLTRTAHWELRAVSVNQLSKIGGRQVENELIRAFKEDDIEVVRAVSAEALGNLKVKRAAPLIAERVLSEEPLQRHRLFIALGKLGAVEAMPKFIRAIRWYGQLHRRASVSGDVAATAFSYMAEALVKNDRKAKAKISFAKRTLRDLDEAKKGLLLYAIATDPVLQKQVPSAAEAKRQREKLDFLTNLKRNLQDHSIDEIIEILNIRKLGRKK